MTASVLLAHFWLNSLKLTTFLLEANTLIEFSFVSVFLAFIIKKPFATKILILCIPVFIVASFIFFFKNSQSFSGYPAQVEHLFCIVFIIYYFFEVMRLETLQPVYQKISFWACVGLLIFFAGNFFFFVFLSSASSKQEAQQIQLIYSFVVWGKNIIFSLAYFGTETDVHDDQELHIPDKLDLDFIDLKLTQN